MSSASSTGDSTEPLDWDELTVARKRLAKTIAHVAGPAVIERPDFQDTVEASASVADVIDDKDRVLKSLNSTSLLNKLVENGYLTKVKQGGNNPIVLDLNYDEDRDTYEVAPFGVSSRLQTIAFDVLDRNDLSGSALDDVDLDNFNAVIDAVNRAVGRTVLVIVSDASKYRIREEALGVVTEKVREAKEDEEDDE